jgi:hypothetical protein
LPSRRLSSTHCVLGAGDRTGSTTVFGVLVAPGMLLCVALGCWQAVYLFLTMRSLLRELALHRQAQGTGLLPRWCSQARQCALGVWSIFNLSP